MKHEPKDVVIDIKKLRFLIKKLKIKDRINRYVQFWRFSNADVDLRPPSVGSLGLITNSLQPAIDFIL